MAHKANSNLLMVSEYKNNIPSIIERDGKIPASVSSINTDFGTNNTLKSDKSADAQIKQSNEPSCDSTKETTEIPETKTEETDAGDVITWKDFTANTTFHGIKYIFHSKANCRR